MILVFNLLIGKMCLYLNFGKTPKIYLCYNLPQFPSEMTTSGSKAPTTFILVYTNYDYRGRFLLANVVITHFESVVKRVKGNVIKLTSFQ